jgi:DNA-binding LytR/AlgR family response regulator
MKLLIAENLSNVEIDLKNRLQSLGFEVVDYVESPGKALEVLENKRVDLVLMDTFFDRDFSGVDAEKVIREKYNTPVLFIASENKTDLAEDIIASSATALILKPVKDFELKVNINLSVENFRKTQEIMPKNEENFNNYIFVRADYKLNKIRIPDIYYIEAKKDYVNIHTSDNVYMVHSTMRDIMKVLPASLFIRIHRSYIVNIDKIFSIKYPELLVESKMKMLPIGGLYRKELFDRIKVV